MIEAFVLFFSWKGRDFEYLYFDVSRYLVFRYKFSKDPPAAGKRETYSRIALEDNRDLESSGDVGHATCIGSSIRIHARRP